MVVAAKFNSREAVITLFSRTLKLEGVSSFFIKPLSVLVITVDPVKMLELSEVSTVSKYSEGWTVGGFRNSGKSTKIIPPVNADWKMFSKIIVFETTLNYDEVTLIPLRAVDVIGVKSV